MTMTHGLLVVATWFVPWFAIASGTSLPASGLHRDVAFTDYSPLSRSDELRRRLLSPLNALRQSRKLARSGRVMRGQPIDLAQERFTVYVPDAPAPAQGYALLVFVSPWAQAVVPQRSIPALNRRHMIFVSAAHSGNDADVMNRRIPLALLAEWNITQRYRVDPSRIYIGGFSGGSRVALRIALGFPDVFHGALLDAGSDPIGSAQIPLPSRELFYRFQNSTRLVYLTGQLDNVNLSQDVSSRQSMREWCVFNLANEGSDTPPIGHQLAGPVALDRALTALEKPVPPFSAAHAGCRSDIDRRLAAKERQIGDLVAKGRFDHARTLLNEVDVRFGGLAAPPSVSWQKSLDAHR
jgi:predicted esterase